MKLSQYKYSLPQDLIADFPAENRDEARLMVLNRAKILEASMEHF